jgi:hypothetical protein
LDRRRKRQEKRRFRRLETGWKPAGKWLAIFPEFLKRSGTRPGGGRWKQTGAG